ncbi:MAG TPA: HlyD family efflux transporter periplasmic adaptor subunit [Candidatus Avoscillospira stercorigallinarum]|uniref:HlyD family efflux transporter periplasmic adaptor subunit n=1 Tax=Candidatus Avoscillospira stercorigallinarum TaxID=2840708 RepID=A0A9D0Z4W6_9FIRM|nr:HlyD family efflux transporter periplasmic adaptor subunit [Candidatus Avoscillospira stercorigallinarum]
MQKTKRREWVKTFAIIFLVILLILTFFSQTIMNRSLPEVAAQYVESGTINAKIRGSGAVSADETYDVTISQTRKIRSVLVKVGDTVNAGDVLFMLEPADSEELKTAQKTLSDLELAYQKSLIEAGNASSTENREVQKLRDAYNEALATLRLYSSADPSQITAALEQAKVELTSLQRASADAESALAEVNTELTEAQQAATDASSAVTTLQTEISALDTQLETLIVASRDKTRAIEDAQKKLNEAYETKNRDWAIHQLRYEELQGYATENGVVNYTLMAAYAADTSFLQRSKPDIEFTEDDLKALADAYDTISKDDATIAELETTLRQLQQDANDPVTGATMAQQIQDLENEKTSKERELRTKQYEADAAAVQVEQVKSRVERYQEDATAAKRTAEDKQAEVDKLTAASTAAETLKTAQTALEDKVFETSLGDSASLDLQNSKKAIEEQQKVVDELMAQADGQEVTANVSGKVTAINVTAGNSAGADTALATLTVVDRGYTVKIAVTADQAKQVTIGDTATITNYYNGDITATLENIANDPQNPGKGKLLVFRLSGEGVEAGSNITLSIGQRSATYDTLVPNSALRNDANGDFVLVVTAKNTPLGNRYTATRVGVTVLAKDDTKSAVTGLSSGDFVITTSTAPIEAGTQVRLVDNG